MVLTPEDLESQALQGIAAEARARQVANRGQRRWSKPRDALARLWNDRVRFWLTAVTSLLALFAILLFARAWPWGGAGKESELVVSMGSSLVFVVLIVGLFAGPAEAGKRLGLGTALLRTDGITWLCLGGISAISLTLLTFAWAEPERDEQLACIALFAAGLGATGLLVVRLLRLSDAPGQLILLADRSLREVRKALMKSRPDTLEALREAQVEQDIAERAARYIDPQAQFLVAQHIRQLTAIAESGWRDGQSLVAANSHFRAAMHAIEYVAQAGAIGSNDIVLRSFIDETDNLHELASGPVGRKLSLSLMQQLTRVGVMLAAKQQLVERDGHNPGVYPFVFEIGTTMMGRRVNDLKSEEPAQAMNSLGDIAVAAIRAGALWSAATTAERIMEWAAAATNTNAAHIAAAAWEEVLRATASLAADPQVARAPRALGAALKNLGRAVEKVDSLPAFSVRTCMGPVLRLYDDGASVTLHQALHFYWRTSESALEAVCDLGPTLARKLVALVSTAPDNSQFGYSKDVGELLYQWITAAAIRADELPQEDRRRSEVVRSVASILPWLRALFVSEGEVVEHRDPSDLLHIYLSACEVTLFLSRLDASLESRTSLELERLLEILSDEVLQELPSTIGDGLRQLADWLNRVGATTLREAATEKAERAEELRRLMRTGGGFMPASLDTWGYAGGTEYLLRRAGLLKPAIVESVESYFLGSGTDPGTTAD